MRSSRGSSGRIAGARTEIRTRSINRQGLIARIKVFNPAAEVYGLGSVTQRDGLNGPPGGRRYTRDGQAVVDDRAPITTDASGNGR
jgi:hypothetical protein